MDEQKKYLGKFPILESSGHEIQRILKVADLNKKYDTDLSLAYISGEFQEPLELHISTAISHETIDEHLIPRLTLVRDLYNATIDYLVQQKLLNLTQTEKVLPPRFSLKLLNQSTFNRCDADPDLGEFKGLYEKIAQKLCDEYGIKNTRTEEDWIHEERIVLPVLEGYTVEMTKPTFHFQNFEVGANNKVGYEELTSISREMMKAVREIIGDRINIDETPYTSCSFYIHLDISQQKLLEAKNLEKLLLSG